MGQSRIRSKRAERRWRIKRFSPLGLLLGVGALVAGGALLFAVIPPRLTQAPEPELLELADTALKQGEYARAYPWLRAAFERPLEHPEAQRPAQLNPEQPVTRAELAAGYEGLAARDLLLADAKSQDYRDLVLRALAESPERGEVLLELLRDEGLGPVLQRALDHQLLEPSLRAIARTAVGLEPKDKRRLARRAALLRNGPAEEAVAREPEAGDMLPRAEVERRLRRIFAFVRDSVAVLPERPLAERGMRYPADTLYQGAGRPAEVNWLLLELMQTLLPREKAWGLELVLAPNPLVPLNPLTSPEIPSFVHEIEQGAQIPDLGTPRHHGGEVLAVMLAQSEAGWHLFAFDAYAGVALLDETGALLDLFDLFSGEAEAHPLLVEQLSYARYRERLTDGRLRLVANPIRASWIGARLQELGLDVGPFPGPSPLTMALEPRLRDDQGRWLGQSLDILGPPPHERDRRVQLAQTIAHARDAGEIAQPRQTRDTAGFPYFWRFQPVREWWIVEALRAEVAGPRVPNDELPNVIQRTAHNDNRLHRQRALDYRRPSDATSQHESRVYTAYTLARLRDRFLFPPEPHERRGPQHEHFTGIPVSVAGSPLTALAEALRRRLPPSTDWTRTAVQRSQGRVGVALGYYWVGEWEMAALSFDDYAAAMRAERTSEDSARYPAKWRYLARFTRGRALWELGRTTEAEEVWAGIPVGAPLSVAARLPAALLEPPQPYFDDFARERPWE